MNLKFYVFTVSQTGVTIGGITGGLIGVILLLLLLAAVFYFRAKQGKHIYTPRKQSLVGYIGITLSVRPSMYLVSATPPKPLIGFL